MAAETAVADAGERRARKEAIRSKTERRAPERQVHPNGRPTGTQRTAAPERGDTRPQRDGNRPARHRQEDNDGTVGFGDDMPAFMRIVAKG